MEEDLTSDVVVFSLDDQHYAFRLQQVQRVLPMVETSPLPGAPPVLLGVISLYGQAVPVLDIRTRLGMPRHDYGLRGHLVVSQTTKRTLALPVDEVDGVRHIDAREVTLSDTLLPGVTFVEGIVNLDDGLLFIHNLETFLSLDEEEQLTQAFRDEDPCN